MFSKYNPDTFYQSRYSNFVQKQDRFESLGEPNTFTNLKMAFSETLDIKVRLNACSTFKGVGKLNGFFTASSCPFPYKGNRALHSRFPSFSFLSTCTSIQSAFESKLPSFPPTQFVCEFSQAFLSNIFLLGSMFALLLGAHLHSSSAYDQSLPML